MELIWSIHLTSGMVKCGIEKTSLPCYLTYVMSCFIMFIIHELSFETAINWLTQEVWKPKIQWFSTVVIDFNDSFFNCVNLCSRNLAKQNCNLWYFFQFIVYKNYLIKVFFCLFNWAVLSVLKTVSPGFPIFSAS